MGKIVKILLDTHIFLWALGNPAKIREKSRIEIETLSNVVFVSSISIAEIMIKSSVGKLRVDYDPVEKAQACGFEILDFRANDALLLNELPFHHRDPFDRMLISQSLANGYPIVTDDSKFSAYDCKLL